MAAKNDVTGDRIASKANSQAYRDGMDRIFGKKAKTKADAGDDVVVMGGFAFPREEMRDAFNAMLDKGGEYDEPDIMRPLKG